MIIVLISYIVALRSADLLRSLVLFEPKQRATVKQALHSPFFHSLRVGGAEQMRTGSSLCKPTTPLAQQYTVEGDAVIFATDYLDDPLEP